MWPSVEHTTQQVIDDAFAEALRRDPEQRRRWVVLVDGQRDQLRRVQRAVAKTGAKITTVLDIVHVLEYLWRAAYAFHPESTAEAETWVECRLLALLNGRSGGELAKSLRLMVRSHGLDAKAALPVERAARYLVTNTRLLHYDQALADGLPIASGVVEGASATSSRTASVAPAPAGRSPAPRRSCACVRCARAATSTSTGSFISPGITRARTAHATPTASSPTRCRAGRRAYA
ncbi:MAG: hypothetical protein IT370_25485 [Deltaproteobacteria bacterium]|nr:hypothetical protein [Deltaproteobacteria bacterium]